jgi:hypothetical protein
MFLHKKNDYLYKKNDYLYKKNDKRKLLNGIENTESVIYSLFGNFAYTM